MVSRYRVLSVKVGHYKRNLRLIIYPVAEVEAPSLLPSWTANVSETARLACKLYVWLTLAVYMEVTP